MKRRMFYRVLVLLLALAAWVTAEIAPALADAGPGLVVSSDGAHWGADLGLPLFDPAVLWVPGDSRTSTFFVQNRGQTPAAVRMQVRTSGPDLVDTGDVLLQARVGSGGWQQISATGTDVLNEVAIGIDQARQVDVRAVFRRGSRNVSQASGVTLRFVVDLGEALGSPPAEGLPMTGAPALGAPLLLGCVLLGTGLALVRRRRTT